MCSLQENSELWANTCLSDSIHEYGKGGWTVISHFIMKYENQTKLSYLATKQQAPVADWDFDGYCYVAIYWIYTEYGNRWLLTLTRTPVIAMIDVSKSKYQH